MEAPGRSWMLWTALSPAFGGLVSGVLLQYVVPGARGSGIPQVKVAYATQLGTWSLEHYGPFARNFWGLLHHLLDLPFKLALPFALWAAFYLPLLLGSRRTPDAPGRTRPARLKT